MRNLIESLRRLVEGNKVAIALVFGVLTLVPLGAFVWPELGPMLGDIWEKILNRWQTKTL